MQEYEVGIAIGNPKNWGKKIGYSALKSILHKAFFGWRINKLVAKIHIENERSINLFKLSLIASFTVSVTKLLSFFINFFSK